MKAIWNDKVIVESEDRRLPNWLKTVKVRSPFGKELKYVKIKVDGIREY